MSQTEIEIAFPTQPFGYVHAKFTADSPAEMEGKLAAYQKQMGLAIQIAGGTDSHAQAVRLIKEEFGATVISEETAPWAEPQAPVAQPWAGVPISGAPVESSGPAPFGAPAPATNAFGAPVMQMGKSPVIKNLPRVPEWDKANWKEPKSPEGQQAKAVRDYCYKAGSKTKWDASRSGFGFETPPSAELLAYLRANLPGIGASLDE